MFEKCLPTLYATLIDTMGRDIEFANEKFSLWHSLSPLSCLIPLMDMYVFIWFSVVVVIFYYLFFRHVILLLTNQNIGMNNVSIFATIMISWEYEKSILRVSHLSIGRVKKMVVINLDIIRMTNWWKPLDCTCFPFTLLERHSWRIPWYVSFPNRFMKLHLGVQR